MPPRRRLLRLSLFLLTLVSVVCEFLPAARAGNLFLLEVQALRVCQLIAGQALGYFFLELAVSLASMTLVEAVESMLFGDLHSCC